MIKPTIGRKLWFWRTRNAFERCQQARFDHDLIAFDDQPEDATVVGVWSPSVVNLYVLDHSGLPRAVTSVQLIQEGDVIPPSSFATWMPYQIGQAKKATQTES